MLDILSEFGSPEEVLKAVSSLSPDEKKSILSLLAEYEARKKTEECRKDFLSFVKEMWPTNECGPHLLHKG